MIQMNKIKIMVILIRIDLIDIIIITWIEDYFFVFFKRYIPIVFFFFKYEFTS